METLIKASPLAIVALDLDCTVRLWNPAAERTFGWSQGELLGRPYPLVPQGQREGFEGLLAETISGRSAQGVEAVRHRKDGSAIQVSIWTAPLYDAAGQVCNVMAVLTDISDRKAAEDALRQYARDQANLRAVASAVGSTLDQDALLHVVLDAVLPALEADAGWVLMPGARPTDLPHVVAQRVIAEGLALERVATHLRRLPDPSGAIGRRRRPSRAALGVRLPSAHRRR